jgi:hypothetical protein
MPASPNATFVAGRVTTGDLDGDGAPDVAVGGYFDGPNHVELGEVDVLFNQGGGTFAGPATTALRLPENVCGLAAAPFGGGAAADLAACGCDDTAQIFADDGHGHFVMGAPLAGTKAGLAMAAADFDGDGRADLAVVNQDLSSSGGPTASLVALLDRGASSFASVSLNIEDEAGALPTVLLPGDIDGDGGADLVGLLVMPALRVYLGHGDGSFSALPAQTLSQAPRNGVLADVDGDGRTDLVLALVDGSTMIYVGDGRGGFEPASVLVGGPGSTSVIANDFDGDGRLDLAVLDDHEGTVAMFPGLGGGHFGAPARCTAGASPTSFASGDLDGDGRPDLVTVDFYSMLDVLLYRGRHP